MNQYLNSEKAPMNNPRHPSLQYIKKNNVKDRRKDFEKLESPTSAQKPALPVKPTLQQDIRQQTGANLTKSKSSLGLNNNIFPKIDSESESDLSRSNSDEFMDNGCTTSKDNSELSKKIPCSPAINEKLAIFEQKTCQPKTNKKPLIYSKPNPGPQNLIKSSSVSTPSPVLEDGEYGMLWKSTMTNKNSSPHQQENIIGNNLGGSYKNRVNLPGQNRTMAHSIGRTNTSSMGDLSNNASADISNSTVDSDYLSDATDISNPVAKLTRYLQDSGFSDTNIRISSFVEDDFRKKTLPPSLPRKPGDLTKSLSTEARLVSSPLPTLPPKPPRLLSAMLNELSPVENENGAERENEAQYYRLMNMVSDGCKRPAEGPVLTHHTLPAKSPSQPTPPPRPNIVDEKWDRKFIRPMQPLPERTKSNFVKKRNLNNPSYTYMRTRESDDIITRHPIVPLETNEFAASFTSPPRKASCVAAFNEDVAYVDPEALGHRQTGSGAVLFDSDMYALPTLKRDASNDVRINCINLFKLSI